ncbi:MAG: methylmalonyl-CoA carboxyltransferase, partial [Dehalococcoidia bacterium]|nr:methylmalonyl-CoA carboxyltransferase [Dehalococcoidia bacterium]
MTIEEAAPAAATARDKLDDLLARKAAAEAGGGEKRIEAQHSRGKLTARERIEILLDDGSFEEVDQLVRPRGNVGTDSPTEAVVTGWGKIDGRPVYLFAYDFTLLG